VAFHHLTLEERYQIYAFLKAGYSIDAIAQKLERAPSTISRELKRNVNPALSATNGPSPGVRTRRPGATAGTHSTEPVARYQPPAPAQMEYAADRPAGTA
jgi:IS30 family transposase